MEDIRLNNFTSTIKSNNSSQIVLVTGATGFIGENLCRKLLAENVIVYALIRDAKNSQPI